jgi:hypothetical protein
VCAHRGRRDLDAGCKRVYVAIYARRNRYVRHDDLVGDVGDAIGVRNDLIDGRGGAAWRERHGKHDCAVPARSDTRPRRQPARDSGNTTNADAANSYAGNARRPDNITNSAADYDATDDLASAGNGNARFARADLNSWDRRARRRPWRAIGAHGR